MHKFPVIGGAALSNVLITTEESLDIDSEEIVRLSAESVSTGVSKLSDCGVL